VEVSEAAQPRLQAIRQQLGALDAAGGGGGSAAGGGTGSSNGSSPEAQRLINEYRMATGDAKVQGVVAFLSTLPGIVFNHQQWASQQASAAGQGAGGGAAAAGSAGTAGSSSAAAGPSSLASSSGSISNGNSGGSGDGRAAAAPGKVLVFAHHQSVLDALQAQLCVAHNIAYVRIDGLGSTTQRQVSGGGRHAQACPVPGSPRTAWPVASPPHVCVRASAAQARPPACLPPTATTAPPCAGGCVALPGRRRHARGAAVHQGGGQRADAHRGGQRGVC
jgi:hypothetical protein